MLSGEKQVTDHGAAGREEFPQRCFSEIQSSRDSSFLCGEEVWARLAENKALCLGKGD